MRRVLAWQTVGVLSVTAWAVAPAADALEALRVGLDEVARAIGSAPTEADRMAALETTGARHIAFGTATRLAVGPAWRGFTPEERQRVVELFRRVVFRTYANQLAGEVSPRIDYGAPVELREGRVEIPTTLTNAGKTYSVLYRLELDPADGKWRVYDVQAEGVSLISNYRAQFDPILRRGGASALISALETRLQNEATGESTKS